MKAWLKQQAWDWSRCILRALTFMSHLYIFSLSSLSATSKRVSQSTPGRSRSSLAPGQCDSPVMHLSSLTCFFLFERFPINPCPHLSAHPAKVWERASPNAPFTVSGRKWHPPPTNMSHSDNQKKTAHHSVCYHCAGLDLSAEPGVHTLSLEGKL